MTAFYNDRFDYIVTRTIQIRDQTGQFTNRQFFINQDYARIRGIEINYNQRVAKWLRTFGNFSYQIATGKSNSAAESALQIREQGFVTASREQFLAWDRPFEFKAGVVLKPNEGSKIGPLNLEYFRVFFTSNFKSGLRYTPFRQNGVAPNGRPIYEVIPTEPFSRIGAPWYWSDLKISYDRKWKRSFITSISLEIRNIFNNLNAQIVNPVTGRGYRDGDPLPFDVRDPRFLDPQASGLPPTDPSRWLPPRQLLLGINFQF
jgi:outer membrane receptor protein involved in Fe transport